MNRLYYADNLTLMRDKMNTASVDLIYLDPPFNSNRKYNLLYAKATGVEDSLLAGFICLSNPTRGMIREASSAGQWEYEGRNYDRIQIRTIQQLLDGIGFNTPTQGQTLNWDRQLHLFPR